MIVKIRRKIERKLQVRYGKKVQSNIYDCNASSTKTAFIRIIELSTNTKKES